MYSTTIPTDGISRRNTAGGTSVATFQFNMKQILH
jgi:hypothetical protein